MAAVLASRCPGPKCVRVRCFPSVFFLGAPKAGTTDLYSSLTSHPHLMEGPRKESQFWARYRLGQRICGQQTGKASLADYLDLYDWSAELMSRGKHRGIIKPWIVGDFTPANGFMMYEWQKWRGNINQSEPRVILAHLLYHIRPDTKFIFNIREPVARALSHYNFGKNRNHSRMEVDVRSKIQGFHECTDKHPLRYCVYSQNYQLLTIGMYAVFIRDWLEVFPRRQIYFFSFDRYQQSRSEVVKEIFEFLDLESVAKLNIDSLDGKKVSLRGNYNQHATPESVIKMLQDFYRPWNRELLTTLQDERFRWDY